MRGSVWILLTTYVCLKAYWVLSMRFGRWMDAYAFEGALKFAVLALPCLAMSWLLYRDTGRSALRAIEIGGGIASGLAFAVLATLPMAAAAIALPRKPLNPDLIAGSSLLGPFAEELLFRGFVFTLLIRRCGWSVAWALIVSSLLFGLAHLRHVDLQLLGLLSGYPAYALPASLKYVVPYAAGGALFAWVAWRRQSLWPAIFLHALMNFWWDVTTGEHGQLDFTFDPMSASQAISAAIAVVLTLRSTGVLPSWRLGSIRRN
ncbi:MAG TPA: CPBP family intramembrane glutamic endopeptidase [Vicinamibacterales bacterium]|nr:CPBP family intramembrane glutamic endopeptidase [Vicinamibacterales bacterium]